MVDTKLYLWPCRWVRRERDADRTLGELQGLRWTSGTTDGHTGDDGALEGSGQDHLPQLPSRQRRRGYYTHCAVIASRDGCLVSFHFFFFVDRVGYVREGTAMGGVGEGGGGGRGPA